MTYTQNIPHHAKSTRPPRPRQNASSGAHIAWLLDIDNQPGYWPINDEDVLAAGEVLPYKRLVDPATGMIRGRFANVAEERDCRTAGYLRKNETVAFILEFPRALHRGRIVPEEAAIAYRIRYDQIPQLVSLDGIDHERARRFTSHGLVRRFSSGRPYTITTMDSEEVPWAAIAIRYKAAVGDNTRRLMHFQNSEPLDLLLSLGARFYANGHWVTCFIPFRHPALVGEIRPLETLVEMSYGLERYLIDGIRRSYVDEDGHIGCVPGPHAGELFDPRTGERLPDTTWAQVALIDSALLGRVRYEGIQSVRRGPSEAQVEQIVAACGLFPKNRWGKRDMFHGSPKGKFTLVIPGKTYREGENSFTGEELTQRLYSRQLALGREFFTNVFEQESPLWLCVDYDVKRINNRRERVCVDHDWLDENIDWQRVRDWEDAAIYPEFRLSGRGFYIEFFFASRMDRIILKDLADRTIMLLKADRLELTKGRRVHVITPSGFRVVKDVTNLSYLVRMPGSVHHGAGFCSSYLNGSLVPPTRRSSPEGVERILALQTPSIYTMPSSLSSPSSDCKASPTGRVSLMIG